MGDFASLTDALLFYEVRTLKDDKARSAVEANLADQVRMIHGFLDSWIVATLFRPSSPSIFFMKKGTSTLIFVFLFVFHVIRYFWALFSKKRFTIPLNYHASSRTPPAGAAMLDTYPTPSTTLGCTWDAPRTLPPLQLQSPSRQSPFAPCKSAPLWLSCLSLLCIFR